MDDYLETDFLPAAAGYRHRPRTRRYGRVAARQYLLDVIESPPQDGETVHLISDSRYDFWDSIPLVIQQWTGPIAAIRHWLDRLRHVNIEHADAVDVIRRYATPTALIYADPPYPRGTRDPRPMYRHEMTDDQHAELLRALRDSPAAVAITTYPNPLYADLLADWEHVDVPSRAHSAHGRPPRTERIYYRPAP